jgi:nucleoside-diphosphate-sugar epimerase
MQLMDRAARSGVNQFIYASSGSVYGVKDEEQVTEDLTLEPISEYNKTKMVAERVALSYAKEMDVSIIRPATVCGLSPRMRLDVSVNMLTMQALVNKKITIFGGDQVRPNIHIDDITDLYVSILSEPEVYRGVFNAGFENISIMDIGRMVQNKLDCEIEVTPSNDPRSYRLNAEKLLNTGFRPKKTVEDAVKEIISAFHEGKLLNEDRCYNLKWMQSNILK